ncbi:MAG TPA: Gfo/Idh/MocA family oxidoreductase [Chthoniobacteraceae bacterium]|nr:Gfo/Idh/MocA family oxidoreductase [Chthoniobacteraceae bacterium]
MTPTPLKLAMLGMIPGNGHPYSWSAIINGQYDREAMAQCPYPVIPVYLGAQPYEQVGIPGAKVTHIWTDHPAEAHDVARAARIDHVVECPEAVIGKVDGVIISTDDGTDHTRRARPFVEAGLPVFIDKPLATTRGECLTFARWHREGARLLSSSGLRYSPDWQPLAGRDWRWITSTTGKTWERYGIHALEPVFKLLGPGFETAFTTGDDASTLVNLTHQSGAKATIAVLPDLPASAGVLHAYGREEQVSLKMSDTYSAFRGQMVAVVEWMRTGRDPYPFEETLELMAILIAGIESRGQGSPIAVTPILNSLKTP